MTKTVLGIIGGSGVYDIPGLENARWERVKSPWGEASDALLFGTIVLLSLMLLSHRTNGGWQYGTRYLTDLVPASVYVVARSRVAVRAGAAMAMGLVIAFNLYALAVFEAITG